MSRCEASGKTRGECASWLTVTIAANQGQIHTVVDRVTFELEERKWPEDDVSAVQLALSEAMANAIRHGCRGDMTKRVQCSVGSIESDEVVIVVRDQGSGFDPGGVPDPLDPSNTFKPSGRGIFLMRVLMDHVVFTDGGREVQMHKRKALERQKRALVILEVLGRQVRRDKEK